MSGRDISIFISYRNIDLSRLVGGNLAKDLTGLGYEVFFDQDRLKKDGGVEWKKVLQKNVENCTVLLVLVEPETKNSDWVRKEIEMARKSKAAVVPIVVVDDTSSIVETLVEMQIDGLQYLEYNVHTLAEISATIENRSDEVQALREREKAWKRGTETYFLHPDNDKIGIELLTGDATEIPNYEILINTENQYMQMARYFESNTLSCTIRRKGSYIDGGFIIDDFVQNQLYRQVTSTPHYPGVPVRPLEVIITEAGHPKSELVEMDFRFIFHAATVTVDHWEQRVDAIPLQAIPEVVVKCLRTLDEVNHKNGAVLYLEKGKLEAERDNFKALSSILFPVFGAGMGGHKTVDAATQIIIGFDKFIKPAKKKKESRIEKIGLCVFNPNEAEEIAHAFTQHGFIRQ